MRTLRVQEHAATTPEAAFAGIAGLGDEWRVPFRGREIRWTQRSQPAPDRRAIAFTQVAGDLRDLSGAWRISPAEGGCEVVFEATYDVGVPIYDRILDPLVEKVLADHARAIINIL
jgi:ribosome-associated toxin RatA of RatAB toxin-antitoxin module